MFASISIKTKLILLIIIALAALLGTGLAGWVGIRSTSASIHEIGEVRLPSVEGLLIISEGQTAVRSANRWALLWENDYKAQANFDKVLTAIDEAWKTIDKGWKLYEPLPQTPEEAVLWKQFVKEWDTWKAHTSRIRATVVDLSRNTSESDQKVLFAKIVKDIHEATPFFWLLKPR